MLEGILCPFAEEMSVCRLACPRRVLETFIGIISVMVYYLAPFLMGEGLVSRVTFDFPRAVLALDTDVSPFLDFPRETSYLTCWTVLVRNVGIFNTLFNFKL